MARKSGILMHITSLPGPYGIGDLGPSAYSFVDFLESSGQSLWEVLSLNIPDAGGSPYASNSSMAGNWLLISPKLLYKQGLLDKNQLPKKIVGNKVNYNAIRRAKTKMLWRAFNNFNGEYKNIQQFKSFKKNGSFWLDEFALYNSIKDYHDQQPWWLWPKKLANRQSSELKKWRQQLEREIEFHKFVQWIFFQQWSDLKSYANRHKIKIFGDLPFFVAYDSVDVWANKKLFLLNKKNQPAFVSGAPPDYFTKTGQLWDDPQYDWSAMQRDNLKWWLRHYQQATRLYDLIRLDHFRGYQALWHIPAKTKDPADGRWQETPGYKIFTTIKKRFKKLPVIAEDLGTITMRVIALKNKFKIPGMRIMLFGFNGRQDDFNLPPNWPANSVGLTGTHDTDTAKGWLIKSGKKKNRLYAKQLLKAKTNDFSWKLITYGMKSKANTFIIPMQDLLNLDSNSRMNTPGTLQGNWQWRMNNNQFNKKLSAELKDLTYKTKRK